MNYTICHMTSVHSRDDVRVFRKMCTSLAANNFKVYLVVADGLGNENLNQVEIIDVGIKKNRITRLISSGKQVYQKSLQLDCDLYHIHDPELIPFGLKLLKKGKKVIFDSHEDFPNQILEKKWIPYILRTLISYLVRIYYKVHMKQFSAVLTVTPHIVENLSQLGVKSMLITNYPEIDSNINIDFDFQNYINRQNDFIYSGTVYESSQQSIILQSIDNIDNIQYTIVGSIEPYQLSNFQKYNSWKKVKYVTFVPKKEVYALYSKATIAACIFDYSPNLGYKKGSLGITKLFEYMQVGLPIICTDFELWKEQIVDKYQCGICVNPHDPKAVKKAIEYLISNKEEAYQMGQNGKRAVIEEFNWASQEKKLIDLYHQILEKK